MNCNKECIFKEIWAGSNIGAKGTKRISESLKINTTLTKLNLGGNWNPTIDKNWIVIKNVVLMK